MGRVHVLTQLCVVWVMHVCLSVCRSGFLGFAAASVPGFCGGLVCGMPPIHRCSREVSVPVSPPALATAASACLLLWLSVRGGCGGCGSGLPVAGSAVSVLWCCGVRSFALRSHLAGGLAVLVAAD